MNRILQTLIIILFAASSCKKERHPNAPVATDPTVPTTQSPLVSVITELSPTTVTAGTPVTIKGFNLGTSPSEWTVYFQDKQATIQSVSSNEIKVIVPSTVSGGVRIQKAGANVPTSSPLMFTYYDAFLIEPYTKGDVRLVTQADVDAFVKLNKGRSLPIEGNLTIGLAADAFANRSDITSVAGLSDIITSVAGTISFNSVAIADAPFLNSIQAAGGINIADCDFTSLSFNSLRLVSGDISLMTLTKLTGLNFNQLTSVKNITISGCTSITDLSCFNSLESAASVTLLSLYAVSSVVMDKLSTINTSGIRLTFNPKLTRLSFRSLNNVTGSLQIILSPALIEADFTALKTVSGRLALKNTKLIDMTGFGTIQHLGALNLTSNGSLVSLHGLKELTSLNMPAINGIVYQDGGPGAAFGISGIAASLGGLTLESNNVLISLAGLENLQSLPVTYVVNNKVLNDLCPFKSQLMSLTNVPNYNYFFTDGAITYKRSVSAVTLINNGSNVNGLATITACK